MLYYSLDWSSQFSPDLKVVCKITKRDIDDLRICVVVVIAGELVARINQVLGSGLRHHLSIHFSKLHVVVLMFLKIWCLSVVVEEACLCVLVG